MPVSTTQQWPQPASSRWPTGDIHLFGQQPLLILCSLHSQQQEIPLPSRLKLERMYYSANTPQERDAQGHIWIIGTEFAKWAREAVSSEHTTLADGEAYCLKCNKPVKMKGKITVKPTNRYLELMTGHCPECNSVVNRARARRPKQEQGSSDQSE